METILVFIFDGMTDYEITLAMHLLSTSLDKNIITVAYEDKVVTARSGALLMPHRLVADPENKNAAGLILCGGWFGDLRPELNELIHTLNEKQAMLAGICGAGTFLLAKAGVLSNVPFTTPITEWGDKQVKVFGEQDPFQRAYYKEEQIVRSGHIITSLGKSFVDFAVEICGWYEPFDTAQDKLDFINYFKA